MKKWSKAFWGKWEGGWDLKSEYELDWPMLRKVIEDESWLKCMWYEAGDGQAGL